MRTVFLALFATLLVAVAADLKPVKHGQETDYVATAVEQAGGSAAGSSVGQWRTSTGEGLYGWQVRRIDPAVWPAYGQLLAQRLKEALQGDGWAVQLTGPGEAGKELHPVTVLATATRGDEQLEVILTLVPQEGRPVTISFSQRRGPAAGR